MLYSPIWLWNLFYFLCFPILPHFLPSFLLSSIFLMFSYPLGPIPLGFFFHVCKFLFLFTSYYFLFSYLISTIETIISSIWLKYISLKTPTHHSHGNINKVGLELWLCPSNIFWDFLCHEIRSLSLPSNAESTHWQSFNYFSLFLFSIPQQSFKSHTRKETSRVEFYFSKPSWRP